MIVKVSALALLCSASAFMLRGFGWRGVPVFAAICSLGLLSFVIPYIREMSSFISSISSSQNLLSSVSAVLKIIGVGYLAGITADVCRDLELPGAANAVVLVGRIEIVAIVTPFFSEIIRMGSELIQ